MPLLRRAVRDDAQGIAPLIVEAAPHLRLLLGGAMDARQAAEAAFANPRTMFGYRFGMVAEEEGEVAGVVTAFPARLWGSLRLGTGVALARAAGVQHAADLVRRGRILDRLHPRPPRDTLYVSALAVAEGHRRKGVARALMDRVIAGAARLDLGVSLDLDVDAEPAWMLYEQLKFRQTEARDTSDQERTLIDSHGFARLVRPRGL